MEALQDKRVRLQPECKKRLQDRIDMWSYAAKVRLVLALCKKLRAPTPCECLCSGFKEGPRTSALLLL